MAEDAGLGAGFAWTAIPSTAINAATMLANQHESKCRSARASRSRSIAAQSSRTCKKGRVGGLQEPPVPKSTLGL